MRSGSIARTAGETGLLVEFASLMPRPARHGHGGCASWSWLSLIGPAPIGSEAWPPTLYVPVSSLPSSALRHPKVP